MLFSLLVSSEAYQYPTYLGMHAGSAAIAAGTRNTEPIMLSSTTSPQRHTFKNHSL